MQAGSEDIDGLGIQEVARQLGVHEQTLRRWIWRGKIKATRSQVGRSYRWLVSADPSLALAEDQSAQQQTVESAIMVADLVSPEPYSPKPVTPQRDRLSALEEQIEREIQRLNAEAATLQFEISRLSHTLGVLRSDEEP